MSDKVIQHPSTKNRQSDVHGRFMELRKHHDAAVQRMWIGTLATSFTDEELALIPYLLCENDRMLMKLIHDPLYYKKRKEARAAGKKST